MSRLTRRVVLGLVLFATLFAATPATAGCFHRYWGRSCYRPYASFRFGFSCNPFQYYSYRPYSCFRRYSYCRPYVYNYCPPVTYCPPVNYCTPVYNCAPVYSSNYLYSASTSRYGNYAVPTARSPAAVKYGTSAEPQYLEVEHQRKSTPTIVSKPLVRTASTTTGSDTRQLARASQWMQVGDRYFSQQKYNDAARGYLSASVSAPESGRSYLRRGHALVALGKYDDAARSFRRGFDLDGNLSTAEFQLSEIYGADKTAKDKHLEVLASSAIANPRDANLMLLLGIFLHYDGQQSRAQKFFRQAAELDRDLAPYAAKFVPTSGDRVARLLGLGG